MNRFQRKQRRTTVLLSLGIVACVATGLYFRSINAPKSQPMSSEVYQQEVDSALERYRTHTEDQMASLVEEAEEDSPLKAELLLYGTCGDDTLRELLSRLDGSSARVRFFLTAVEASTYSGMQEQVTEAGYELGVFNDGSNTSLAGVSAETAVSNLSRASTAMQSAYGVQPSSIMLLEPADDELLYAARAAYIDRAYLASSTVELSSVTSQDKADELIKGLRRGELLALRLGTGSSTVDGMTYILKALEGTDLDAKADALLAQPLAQPAEAVRLINTVERAAAFDFSGLGSEKELTGVLDALRGTGATATFFFTADELEKNPAALEAVLAGDHDLGISVETSNADTERGLLKEILLTRELLAELCGYDGETPVRAHNGNRSEALNAASAAGGYTLISADLVATKADDVRAADAAEVLARVMPESWGSLHRGEIVHFQLGMYQREELLGELVTQLARNRSAYAIRPVMDILGNTEALYTYPVADEDILPLVRDAIRPGQLKGDAFSEIRSRYIGIDWVNSTYYLPGFTEQEVAKLDMTGFVSNNRDMVFLSFDDWGTDATITRLLDVLKKHDAKATFFVRTSVIESNPNLLRAIAEEGHAIGCHTDGHLPLSIVSDNGYFYSELSETQAEELRDDLVLSYQKLQSIIGDVQVDGQPALSRLFRPPTLAVGKLGLTTVFDCGFTYSVSGSFTTQDYLATSADSLAANMKQYTRSGSVLIMHMSDNSIYTADALDIYLTGLEQGNTQYRFARLTDVLYKGERS